MVAKLRSVRQEDCLRQESEVNMSIRAKRKKCIKEKEMYQRERNVSKRKEMYQREEGLYQREEGMYQRKECPVYLG